MNTGFVELDKLINFNEPEVIAFTGLSIVDMLTGDIANNICLNQECDVLEMVSHKKEYLIKRLVINQANVNYRNWYRKAYNDEELKQIALSTINLFETTKRLPSIIETDVMNIKDIIRYIKNYANHYADREEIRTLIVLDMFPLNDDYMLKNSKYYMRYKRECKKILKSSSKICKRLRCPIIFVYFGEINNIKKYIDKYVVMKEKKAKNGIMSLEVHTQEEVLGTCELKYNSNLRKFENVKRDL